MGKKIPHNLLDPRIFYIYAAYIYALYSGKIKTRKITGEKLWSRQQTSLWNCSRIEHKEVNSLLPEVIIQTQNYSSDMWGTEAGRQIRSRWWEEIEARNGYSQGVKVVLSASAV